ncbi:helix-turn-helix domain-containing protein [Christiangramia forsetii]|uniref:HTH_3 family transcriptional regulator protein n=2 Tax=Christiangramia forsetii TaxID=411153 RepID=A0M4Q3_CHRFK|nr:helix-turn-helix transcriptional regulator [Christiangramia forsetii]GGG22906.1 hypothetical protein GCM10011532_02490 [Christiangramia forsetii]CAL67598.1 HTH_3 family transcriptional regulator protein [Christiangramia forsetii KT0803]
MSLFGKNIRKIRSVKSLSQQSFAEIFDLKRGTLGAYEEGRSEPKIETIIKIANHFSIPIGDILTEELTVNQLLKFRGDLENPNLSIKNNSFIKVPCITPGNHLDYIHHCDNKNFIKDLPDLNLPVNNNAELRGFIIDNLEMSKNNEGLYPKDVVIGEKVARKNFTDIQSSCLFLVITDDKILMRRLFQANKKFILKADHRGIEDLQIKYSEIKEVWEVKYVFFHRVLDFKNNEVQEKLSYLEEEFNKLKSSL